MAFTDRTATPGSTQTYRLRVTTPLGNTATGGATMTVPSGTSSASPYADAVTADSPSNYWRLGEAGGTKAYDWASGNDVTVASDTQRGTAGALTGDADAASTFSGCGSGAGHQRHRRHGPQTFSVEAWFKTTSTAGGKIIGFGDSNTGDSTNYDRHLYMDNSGKLVFGVYNGTVSTITSPAATTTALGTRSSPRWASGGMTLYVDGVKVGSRADVTFAQTYAGYWRVGGDNLNGWPSGPSSN